MIQSEPAVIKPTLDRWSQSPDPIRRALARMARALGYVRRFAINSRIRWEQLTRLRYGARQYQVATATESNRYPELFEACRRYLQQVASPRILSFGCSTGEEPQTIAEYIPNAIVIGVDINDWCLRECRRRNQNPQIRFLHAMDPELIRLNELDAIFCMAVFQRTENRTRPAEVAQGGFTFDKFEEEINTLDQKLKVGGLLFIEHADFRFQDTNAAGRYSALELEGDKVQQQRPLFGRDNCLIARQYAQHRAFVKLA